jgi:ribosome-associated heat shock protein Hsp15
MPDPIPHPSQVRLDKWLQVARMFKTRSQATRACTLNRVRVNDQTAKPHRNLSVGDRVEIDRGDGWSQVIEVRRLADKPVRKAEAPELYEDLSGPRPKMTDMEKLMRRPPAQRERGMGRPTKRERRHMERWREEE